ncbi:MAG: hypothetical protein NT013_03000, partial [Planctomycetia bacterium]|nr:hypothetical protein [Planctomycetia bacterium]
MEDLEALAIALPVNATQAGVTIEVAQGTWRTLATVEGKRFLQQDTTSESGTEWQVVDRKDGIRLFVDYYHDRELILHKKRVCVITASPLTEGGAMPRKAVRIEATERQLEILRT